MRFFLLVLSLLCAAPLWSQITFIVDAIPANTPAGDPIYLAGNMNGWNPGNPNWVLTQQANGHYAITFTTSSTNLSYKFTRGGWSTVEGNANGGFRPDRSATVQAGDTIYHQILSWEGQGSNSTAAANVVIDSADFYIPQLNRTRRIWVYLPPDYADTGMDYPVLYMHDGQNVFDAATSFSGEWQVDETLNRLHAEGDTGIIVVAIDNGGASRLDEYSPWVNPQYGGGEGDLYVQFIANTLKPYIDGKYRTKPDAAHTGIMGSSMGGLISAYAVLQYPETFGLAGVFSPSYWFSSSSLQQAQQYNSQHDVRIYQLAGGQEGASMVKGVQAMDSLLRTKGFADDNLVSRIVPAGTHSEAFWRQEFAAAYQWLFRQVAPLHTSEKWMDSVSISLLPNPADKHVTVQASPDWGPFFLTISNLLGQVVVDQTVMPNTPVDISSLEAGFYLVQIGHKGQVTTIKLQVER